MSAKAPKAEERLSFTEQKPEGGNDAAHRKGLANRGVSEPKPDQPRKPS